METWKVDADRPPAEALRAAAEMLRAGKLVAFPTETVYGLGANALSAEAVAGIYRAKGRPSRNPLIVHVADVSAARAITTTWPMIADRLADRFWPGPLTLVLPAATIIPEIVRGGGATVGIRCPDHPIALALLREAGVPIAAPSANRSNAISPTTAQHVADGLGDRIDGLIDGGPTSAGLESTVLDLSTPIPRILRPGPIAPTLLATILGMEPLTFTQPTDEPLLSPGMLAVHYSPRTLTVRSEHPTTFTNRDALLSFGMPPVAGVQFHVDLGSDAARAGAELYAALHRLDASGAERIVVWMPPITEAWLAVRDRLTRAATPTDAS